MSRGEMGQTARRPWGVFWSWVVAALVGFWRLRSRAEIVKVLMLPVAYFTIVHMFVGDAEPRYYLPAVPALLIAANSLVTRGTHGARLDDWTLEPLDSGAMDSAGKIFWTPCPG